MREAFAHEARVSMDEGGDPAAIGAAITQALCGHWRHEGPCPVSPHHTAAQRDGPAVRVRVLFATEAERETTVRAVIDEVLARGQVDGPRGPVSWTSQGGSRSQVLPGERDHAERLRTT